MRSPVAEVLQVKKTDISRYSAWVLAASMLLALAACSEDKKPETVDGGTTGPIRLESVISDPKVGTPGDTLLFTAVITSSAENQGDYAVFKWSANGGTLIETDKQSVRWASPNTAGIFTITATASNDVNSVTNKTSVFVGTGENLITENAGQVDLITGGPNFHFLKTGDIGDIKTGVDITNFDYASRTSEDSAPPLRDGASSVAYSLDGAWAAYVADTTYAGLTVKPRNIYLTDFASHSAVQISVDGGRPANPERNVYNHPSFSPNSQVIAFQRLAQAWDPLDPDSFHVYIYDRVIHKRTLVTSGYQYPRALFPTFSTDSKWLVYALDTDRTGQWELYGSPMTGNEVAASAAAAVRLTNTGGSIISGAPKEIKQPPMAWNPVAPILALAGTDNVLYLVQTTSTGANVISVPEVSRATEVAWSPDGSQMAASYFVTDGEETHYKVATVSPAGVVTVRTTGLVGDILRDLAFSPDGKWLLYRVTRGGGMWFNVVDTGAGKFTDPVPVTQTDPTGASVTYRDAMSLRPTWTNTNTMFYPAWGTSTNNTPGVWTRDLSGVVN
jgi:hypothetical protein